MSRCPVTTTASTLHATVKANNPFHIYHILARWVELVTATVNFQETNTSSILPENLLAFAKVLTCMDALLITSRPISVHWSLLSFHATIYHTINHCDYYHISNIEKLYVKNIIVIPLPLYNFAVYCLIRNVRLISLFSILKI